MCCHGNLVGVCALVMVYVPHKQCSIIVTGCHLVLEVGVNATELEGEEEEEEKESYFLS